MKDVHIAEASAAQLEDVLYVERLAFGGDEEAELVRSLLDDPTAQPALSLLARSQGAPVGHILFTAVRLVGAQEPVDAAILAPLAVVPDHQRRGVGGRLIEQGVEILSTRGVSLVFVLGHPSYYPLHGFVPAIPLGLLAPQPISLDEAWMVRPLRPGVLGGVQGRVECAETMNRPEYWVE